MQELGAALLRMDRVIGQDQASQENLPAIQTSLQNAIQEVRALASGLGLPQLEGLSLAELLEQVVNSHEHRTGSQVSLSTSGLPEQADLSVKITLYRIVQESVANIVRHANASSVVVEINNGENLLIAISNPSSFRFFRKDESSDISPLAKG